MNTDFAPTFADLGGVEFTSDGRSFASLLRGEDPAWRSSILIERLNTEESGEEANDEGKGKSKGKDKAKRESGGAPPYEAIRTGTHKYVEHENGERELYDLEADPYELDNIYESADFSLVEDLETRLEALRGCSEDGCREAEDAR